MQESEAAAVARARTGDGEAFRVLVERYGRSVFRLAFRLTGNEQDAEDVVQETFLRAYRQLGRYDGRASFHTWIYRIASNYALDLLRARRNGAPPADDLPCGEPPADRLAMSAQIDSRLRLGMAELSEQERIAFVMRHFEGMSIDEIGAQLGIAESATKNSIFRAVQKLRRRLAPFVGGAA
jgi:RNA polymerase sigma-70 factor (ECF subfamily)